MPPNEILDELKREAAKLDSLDIASDRLDGAEAIAAFRGEPVHRTRYLIRKGLIPVAHEGERIVGASVAYASTTSLPHPAKASHRR